MHVRSYMYAVSETEAPVTKDKRNAGSEEINKQSNPNICGMGQPVTSKKDGEFKVRAEEFRRHSRVIQVQLE